MRPPGWMRTDAFLGLVVISALVIAGFLTVYFTVSPPEKEAPVSVSMPAVPEADGTEYTVGIMLDHRVVSWRVVEAPSTEYVKKMFPHHPIIFIGEFEEVGYYPVLGLYR